MAGDPDVDQELSVYQVQQERAGSYGSCVGLCVRKGLDLGLDLD